MTLVYGVPMYGDVMANVGLRCEPSGLSLFGIDIVRPSCDGCGHMLTSASVTRLRAEVLYAAHRLECSNPVDPFRPSDPAG